MSKDLPSCTESLVSSHKLSSCKKIKILFNRKYNNLLSLFTILSLLFFTNAGYAQSSPNEAEWNGQGYSLKKIVSNTSIPSGVNFSYTIIFSAPAGATNITIFDEVPQAIGNISVPPPSPVNGVTPGIQINGNNVSYTLTGLPANTASSGSFTIVTSFPAGTTCPGTVARNQAGIYIGEKLNYTPHVSTTATAEDPWKISKSILSGVVSNPQGGSCGYLMNEGDTVSYRLHVSKKSPFWGNTNGQLNASNAIVSDMLPAGAQLINSNTNSGTVVQNGNTIEWTIGNLDATVAYTNYTCNIDVYYPAGTFPNGTTIYNQADLDAEICGQPVAHQSNETCIEVDEVIENADAYFYKQISLTNRVPGCQGYYNIVLCNNGNVDFSNYHIIDDIPQGITVTGVNVYNADATTTFSLTANNGNDVLSNNINGYYTSGNIGYNVNDLNLEMTNEHPVGKCIFMRVYFTIDNNVPIGQQITNCAHFDGLQNNLTLDDACVSFTAEEGEPRPCLNKDICDVQTDYEPGDTVRFRLRVQNIGSATMTGATIQDNLNSNFSYAGNESYYEASSYSVPCSSNGQIPANTTAWQGVTPSHSGNNLSWNLPDIASDCQLFYVGFCSYYGTWALPYYYIEFDAVVDSFAMPGVTPNEFEISGGNLAQTNTSNTVYALVVASLGQEISKQVSSDNGSNFANSANVAPGSNARYRLSYTNTSNIPLSEIEMVDLLAFNDNSDDWLILNRNTPRGSQFGVDYTGNHTTSLQPPGTLPTTSVDFSSGDNLCLPNFGVNLPGCTTSPGWNASPDKNVRMSFGTLSLAPAQALNEDFDVSVASTIGHDSTSCNDFAARASANFLLNGSPQAVTLTPIAAPPVCITTDTLQVSDSQCCENTTLETIQAPALGECCIQLQSECEVDSFHVDITNGSFSASSWNCGTMPIEYVGLSSYTFDVANCAVDMTSCIAADSTGVVSANYTIYYSNGEVCEKFIEMDCHVQEPACCENVNVNIFQDPDLGECCAQFVSECETDSVMVTITNGTFDIVTLNGITPTSGFAGQSSFTFDTNAAPADLKTCVNADSTGLVSINYVSYFANGEECEQNVRMDCEASEPECCKNVDVSIFQNPDLEGECCTQFVSECETDSVMVSITNGTFDTATLNGTSLSSGFSGQSSFTFDTNSTTADLVTCVTPASTGVVYIDYVTYFANGEKCESRVEMDCKAPEPECCENVKVDVFQDPDLGECCAQFVSECETDSVMAIVSNGTFDFATLNGATLTSGFAGQSSFTFDTNSAPAELITCVTPNSTGAVYITYVSYFANGEKCEKRVEMDCKASECCENVKVDVFQDPDLGACCAQFVSECETDSVMAVVSNGTFDYASLNGSTLTSGFAGQSSFTFDTNSAPAELVTCVTPSSTGTVYITYVSYFANGEKCEKRVKMDCEATEPDPSSCCPELDFKLKSAWPEKNTHIGYFSITNPDPSSPICSVEINPTPGGSFSTGNLWIDGNLSGQSWSSSNIPASGNLMPEAYNSIDFMLKAKGYKGAIEVCIIKCDGTVCCFEVNWNKLPVIDADIEAGDINIGNKLLAVSVSPHITTPTDERVKYVAFGYFNEDEANDDSKLFAASTCCFDYNSNGELSAKVTMNRHSAFFEFNSSYAPSKGEQYGTLPKFNLVFEGKMPKIACTLFSEEGNIIYSGSIDVIAPDTATTSIITPEIGAKSANEILKLYPNPNNGSFTVTFATESEGNMDLQIINNAGQVIQTESLWIDRPGLHEYRIDAPGLPDGVNHVILKNSEGHRSRAFIRK
ncbi:MAG TPA: hypothetical protein VJ909_01430 [Prolixibacteraceae bacterium]|nr:hypothetical protein [Prolixibacteraceae bacterium]